LLLVISLPVSLDNIARGPSIGHLMLFFGKVGRIASEDVIIELLKAKCLPALYYGLEACPVNKSQIRSLEYDLRYKIIRCRN